jgi:hypothetical protein
METLEKRQMSERLVPILFTSEIVLSRDELPRPSSNRDARSELSHLPWAQHTRVLEAAAEVHLRDPCA